MTDFEEIGENLQTAVRGEHRTAWSVIVWLTMLLYLTSGAVSVVPAGFVVFDVVLVVFALIFLACWLPFPLWLYLDRKRVVADTDYRPSKLYYLGWLPGYLGVAAVALYLHRRGSAYRTSDVERPTPESRRETQF